MSVITDLIDENSSCHARIAELEARIVWLECELQVNAAPVSEAKAQGVVMPERWNVPRPMWKDARQPYGNPLNHADIEAAEKFNLALDEVARLNAAPAQQVSVPVACSCGMEYPANSYSAGFISGSGMCEVCDAAMPPKDIPQQASVPDGWKLVPVEPTKAMLFACEDAGSIHNQQRGKRIYEAMLAAAPAAPAADAGIVDMYRHLQKVTPYRFKKIQDASITDGGDVMYFHKDRFDAALLADMAAHCAKESK